MSCLIAEVQPDFQSYLIIQIVGIHRSSPLVIGGMMIKYGRDIKSQRILTGNRSIDEVSTIIWEFIYVDVHKWGYPKMDGLYGKILLNWMI